MIRVMAVDDEFPALKMVESVLRTFNNVHICGLFHDPEELLEQLTSTEVDLVLIDMQMPDMHGLELAGRIQEFRPGIEIAFVTAYDHYAVDAFEVDALDYLLKPITEERLRKTLNRVAKKSEKDQVVIRPNRYSVRSFGRFFVEVGQGQKLKFRRSKTEELLAFLLHQRGQPVAKQRIMDALWGDRDAERAQSMLYTTMYQARKEMEQFGLHDVIDQTRSGGGVCRLSWVPDEWDCEEFEEACRSFKKNGDMAVAERAAELYLSGYLSENGYEWAEERRAELELMYVELLESMGDLETQRKRFQFAFPLFQKLVKLQPYTERIHVKIIALHLLMNNEEEALMHKRKVKELFVEDLGVSPDMDIRSMLLNPLSIF
ncbi:hypothetical protein PMSD_11135 [Paenibacillus macquariensis subsp. defensor]|nr:hypothetical protein PMSD_11135 [Paenibacillus macquariensis subsp. defensor]